ncbi:Hypothetical protein HEAR1378 [Herminiimonas arsenicoxydans]|uniref:Uncharacterized protein n=1 Tax=Herminiimonas arsenicoxydans TaxID=204773 RepID=A4G4W3_HERAR|nr:Hypothetical protein HEAR1378 [Herminiimonas arsenicoxydans]
MNAMHLFFHQDAILIRKILNPMVPDSKLEQSTEKVLNANINRRYGLSN